MVSSEDKKQNSGCTIQGQRHRIAETEEAWNSILKKLYNMPFKSYLLEDWNKIGQQTDECVAESVTDYIAKLYMKHPQTFLT